jgi:hypothetical protein
VVSLAENEDAVDGYIASHGLEFKEDPRYLALVAVSRRPL